MRKLEVLLDGLCFPEGPRWRDGVLWFSDMHADQVMTVDLAGEAKVVLEIPEHPSGLGWLPDNRLLVVSMTNRRVLMADANGYRTHADLGELTEHDCNDMVVDGRGNAYVGNFGFDLAAYRAGEVKAIATRLVLVTPDGHARKVGGPVWFPNGAVITPDGGTLIVGETFGNRLTAFDIQDDGSLINQRIWSEFEHIRPDGITLDADGAIWTSSPGSHAVYRIAQGGEILETIELQQQSFACMLGGNDGRTLFILTANSAEREKCRAQRVGRIEITTVDVPRAGLP
jgi:sugar lactone lactonase YvrE